MKMYRYLVLLVVASSLWAMPNIDGSWGVLRAISADNGTAGMFNLGWYARGFFEDRIADATGDAYGNSWIGTNATYGGGDMGLSLGYSVTDWFSFNLSGVFHGDGIDYEDTDTNRASVGFGDTKVGMKLSLGQGGFCYGLYGFVSLATGSDRDVVAALESQTYPIFNEAFTNPGGLFRYFSSGGLELGAVGLVTLKSGVMKLDLNFGYADKKVEDETAGLRNNYSIYSAALSFETGPITPFIELSGIDYGGKDEFFTIFTDSAFGPNQVFITPGVNFEPGNFNIKLAVDIRAIEGENEYAFPTAVGEAYNIPTGWGVAPSWAVFLGIAYSSDFIPEKPKTGTIAGKVFDDKTKAALTANLAIYSDGVLIKSAVSDVAGVFDFRELGPGIYKLTASMADYEPYEVELLVKAGETTPLDIGLKMIPKEGTLILKIMDFETKAPMSAKVTIGNLQTEMAEASFQKILKPGSYVVNVVTADENYLPYERIVQIEAGKTLEIEVGLVKKEFKIVLPQVYFETAKSDIKPESYPVLDDAVKTIKQVLGSNPNIRIEIQGHTDSIGSDAYNLTLSQDRANSVLNYLVTRHQIDATRLIAKGFGESSPIASNKTLDGRARNRRVEFVILK